MSHLRSPHPRPRPRTGRFLRCLLAVLGSLLILLPAAPTAAAAPAAGESTERGGVPGIVGTWIATITRQDGVVERDVRFVFSTDGRMTVSGPDGDGVGTWQRTAGVRFAFDTRTPTDFGAVLVHADVVVDRDRLIGAGRGTGVDSDGNVLGTSRSVITAYSSRALADI